MFNARSMRQMTVLSVETQILPMEIVVFSVRLAQPGCQSQVPVCGCVEEA